MQGGRGGGGESGSVGGGGEREGGTNVSYSKSHDFSCKRLQWVSDPESREITKCTDGHY